MTKTRNNNDGDAEGNNKNAGSATRYTIDALIKELFKPHSNKENTIVTNRAKMLFGELSECMITETCIRAVEQAVKEGCQELRRDHIDKGLEQILKTLQDAFALISNQSEFL